jgi:hypothetical protein
MSPTTARTGSRSPYAGAEAGGSAKDGAEELSISATPQTNAPPNEVRIAMEKSPKKMQRWSPAS